MSDKNLDLEVVSREELFEEFVHADDESQIAFLQARWVRSMLEYLVELREVAGLSQRELAELLGTHQPTVARAERGKDMKLSTFFRHAACAGAVPIGLPEMIRKDLAIDGIGHRHVMRKTTYQSNWREDFQKKSPLWAKAPTAPAIQATKPVSTDSQKELREREAAAA